MVDTILYEQPEELLKQNMADLIARWDKYGHGDGTYVQLNKCMDLFFDNFILYLDSFNNTFRGYPPRSMFTQHHSQIQEAVKEYGIDKIIWALDYCMLNIALNTTDELVKKYSAWTNEYTKRQEATNIDLETRASVMDMEEQINKLGKESIQQIETMQRHDKQKLEEEKRVWIENVSQIPSWTLSQRCVNFIPKNHHGLEGIFGRMYDLIGFEEIVKWRISCPDVIAIKNKKEVGVELELYSSQFNHPSKLDKVDYIVCWENNKTNYYSDGRPIPTIEFRSLILPKVEKTNENTT